MTEPALTCATKNPPPTTCAHIVARKKRRCRSQTRQDSAYCGEHAIHHAGPGDTDRIPCPLDPKHFILKSKVSQHLKICNALKFDYSCEVYYSCDVNVLQCTDNTLVKQLLSALPLQDLIKTCTALLKYGSESKLCKTRCTAEVTEAQLEVYKPLFIKPQEIGAGARKHAVQQVALVNCLADFYRHCGIISSSGSEKMNCESDTSVADGGKTGSGLAVDSKQPASAVGDLTAIKTDSIPPDRPQPLIRQTDSPVNQTDSTADSTADSTVGTCFVELGAGTGKMSQWFHAAAPQHNNFFVLVDRKICRHKADSYFKKSSANFTRLKMDIKDIDVFKIPEVCRYSRTCVACKHLCGGATDLALVAARRAANKPTSVLIALCCHHLCSWQVYCGKEYFLKHFTRQQFYVLSSISAWATCFKIADIQTDNTSSHIRGEIETFLEKPDSYIEDGHLILDKTLKWCIGRCAKMVLNDGRAWFMREAGFSTEFAKYVDVTVSPENTALLCTNIC